MADTTMSEPPRSPPSYTADPNEPLYGGYTRFELELEFVTLLSNPLYLNHLASLKLLQSPDFIAYLAYLQYWTRPAYIKFLSYPGPTLKALELLQEEKFRRGILSPEMVGRWGKGLVEGGVGFVGGGGEEGG